ncbi:hypothetical protein VNO77_41728 [Canavalia gladiata]|uniref:Uncharacterized protein n=1 Tax=Canavalia gladiata TaxID=3824 RepID=A0AAN9K1H9_CANGL
MPTPKMNGPKRDESQAQSRVFFPNLDQGVNHLRGSLDRGLWRTDLEQVARQLDGLIGGGDGRKRKGLRLICSLVTTSVKLTSPLFLVLINGTGLSLLSCMWCEVKSNVALVVVVAATVVLLL